MRNPKEYCIKCDRRYGFADEYCEGCGFNPIDGGEDEDDQTTAEAVWEAKQSD